MPPDNPTTASENPALSMNERSASTQALYWSFASTTLLSQVVRVANKGVAAPTLGADGRSLDEPIP